METHLISLPVSHERSERSRKCQRSEHRVPGTSKCQRPDFLLLAQAFFPSKFNFLFFEFSSSSFLFLVTFQVTNSTLAVPLVPILQFPFSGTSVPDERNFYSR